MRKFAPLVLIAALGVFDTAWCATEPHLVPIERGLSAYVEGGAKEAIEGWISGAAIEGSKETISQAKVLKRIENFYGPYEDYEIALTKTITRRLKMVIVVMNYQKGPLIARFFTYMKKNGDWVLTIFEFNIKAEQIIPALVMSDGL